MKSIMPCIAKMWFGAGAAWGVALAGIVFAGIGVELTAYQELAYLIILSAVSLSTIAYMWAAYNDPLY